jgi:hypothetical protein
LYRIKYRKYISSLSTLTAFGLATLVTPNMSDTEEAAAAAAAPADPEQVPEPGRGYTTLHLPEFWPETPAAWFLHAESKFRLRRITAEWDKYDHLVSALPRASVRLVLDLLENPDEDQPYTALKEKLLSSHELTNFERIEKLMQLEPLGGRKPTELLAEMLELCPRGQESNMFFLFLFLQRLPRELRMMLDEDDSLTPRQLAAKADKLWAKHTHQHGSVAAVADDDHTVAAVQPSRSRGGGFRGRGQRPQRSRGGRRAAPSAVATPASEPETPSRVARSATGLCFYHWTFGEQAHKCEPPCSWGN